MLALVLEVARLQRSRIVWAAVALWAWEELQVIACGTAWLIAPWPIGVGQDTCSAWTGVDVAKISCAAAALVLYRTCQKLHLATES